MAVTIQMIETKEFQVVPTNGYDPDEVDRFLDDVVDELERLQKELKTLRDGKARPMGAGSPSSGAGSEETVKNMLVNAQRVCDDTIADAKKRAEETLREARAEAEHIVHSARAEERQLNADNVALRTAVTDYRASFRRMLDEQLRLLKADE